MLPPQYFAICIHHGYAHATTCSCRPERRAITGEGTGSAERPSDHV
jgi:hypothetical protein